MCKITELTYNTFTLTGDNDTNIFVQYKPQIIKRISFKLVLSLIVGFYFCSKYTLIFMWLYFRLSP